LIKKTVSDFFFHDFEAFLEGFVVEDQFDLFVAFGFQGSCFAVATTETNLGTFDADESFFVDLCSFEGALHAFGLFGKNQLVIGFGGVLFGVLLKCLGAIGAAEEDRASIVTDGKFFLARFPRHGAGWFNFLGFFARKNCKAGEQSDRTSVDKNSFLHGKTFRKIYAQQMVEN